MSGRERPLVLVVDDYGDTLEVTQDYLEFRGFDVVCASDGAAGLARAAEHVPDVMLVDLGLPDIPGVDVIRRVKSGATTSSIPVVAFSGHVLQESEDEARAAGADGFLKKPAVPEDIVLEVRRLLARGA